MDASEVRNLLLKMRRGRGVTPEVFEVHGQEILDRWGVADGVTAVEKLRGIVEGMHGPDRSILLMSLGLENSHDRNLTQRQAAYLKLTRKYATSKSDLYRKDDVALSRLASLILSPPLSDERRHELEQLVEEGNEARRSDARFS